MRVVQRIINRCILDRIVIMRIIDKIVLMIIDKILFMIIDKILIMRIIDKILIP